MEPRCFLSGKQFCWFHRDESIFILVTRNGNVPQKNTKISRLFNADRYAHYNDFNRHQHVGLSKKSEGGPISPKGCPRPVGNGEMSPSWLPRSEMFFALEVLPLQGRRLFRTRELAAEAR
jgi:hypothetical protein